VHPQIERSFYFAGSAQIARCFFEEAVFFYKV